MSFNPYAQPYAASILPQVMEMKGSPAELAQELGNLRKEVGEIAGLKEKMDDVVTSLNQLSSPGVNIDREGISVITMEQQAKNMWKWLNA
ncbi:MAG: hypothetical protein EOP52_13510 [Sphingobacteriales bacterium]|nr:MAG: hypothetical protein EOP52_13510 [Sphingobacteriales bacterium]